MTHDAFSGTDISHDETKDKLLWTPKAYVSGKQIIKICSKRSFKWHAEGTSTHHNCDDDIMVLPNMFISKEESLLLYRWLWSRERWKWFVSVCCAHQPATLVALQYKTPIARSTRTINLYCPASVSNLRSPLSCPAVSTRTNKTLSWQVSLMISLPSGHMRTASKETQTDRELGESCFHIN